MDKPLVFYVFSVSTFRQKEIFIYFCLKTKSMPLKGYCSGDGFSTVFFFVISFSEAIELVIFFKGLQATSIKQNINLFGVRHQADTAYYKQIFQYCTVM